MPFLRFSRDKRGYEHTYLVHTASRRGKPSRPRLLYWYRTPPGVKVGRLPFDDEIRRLLEAQYPGIPFDWQAIVSTPIPPAEPEYWRERRRVERAAKQARRLDDVEVADLDAAESLSPLVIEPAELPAEIEVAVAIEALSDSPTEQIGDGAVVREEAPSPSSPADATGRRRRRRGGRRRRGRSEAQAPIQPVELVEAGEVVTRLETFESVEVQVIELVEPTEPDNPLDPGEPDEE